MSIPATRIRVSRYTYLIAILGALQAAFAALSLLLPWGRTAAGHDIRIRMEGLLPWFMVVPVLLQLGFLLVESRFLQVIYIIANFLLALFILCVQYLSSLKYAMGLQAGFYMVYAGAAAALVAGILCMVETRAFPALLEKGKARTAPAKDPAKQRG